MKKLVVLCLAASLVAAASAAAKTRPHDPAAERRGGARSIPDWRIGGPNRKVTGQ